MSCTLSCALSGVNGEDGSEWGVVCLDQGCDFYGISFIVTVYRKA